MTDNLLTPVALSDLPIADINLTPTPPTQDQLQRDCGYFQAQKLLKQMLDAGLISLSEFNKITALNRESFSPYLVEIFPKLT